MVIREISLLTADEFNMFVPYIPDRKKPFWLRSSSGKDRNIFDIVRDGKVYSSHNVSSIYGVRPVLKVTDIYLAPGDKIKLFGFYWTVLDVDTFWNGILFCDVCIFNSPIDRDSNQCHWELSILRTLLNRWLDEELAKTVVAIDIKNKAEYLLLCSFAQKYGLADLPVNQFSNHEKDFFGNVYITYIPYFDWDWETPETCKKKDHKIYTFAQFCQKYAREGE